MSKKKVIFTYHYGEENFARLEQLGYEVVFLNEFAGNENYKADFDKHSDVDVLACFSPFDRIKLADYKNLEFIQLVSVGFNHVPIDDIRACNIKLAHNVGTTKYPISEWIMAQLFTITKQTRKFYDQQKEKVWQNNKNIIELAGKKVTFLGAGNIATETARKFKAFDAVTCALNINEDPVEFMDSVVHVDKIDNVLPESDIVISCLPATKATHHILNKERLNSMKDSSILINISRGAIIDEQALIEVLKTGKFMGVALDVFEQEPLDTSSDLWGFDNVIITPHNAIFSDLSDDRVFELIYDNLKRYISGEEIINIVHYDRGY